MSTRNKFGRKEKNGLISYHGLVDLVNRGVIEEVVGDHINAASIDITLGHKLLIEDRTDGYKYKGHPDVVSLRNRDSLKVVEWNLISQGPYVLKPGEFILAHSYEVFNLPDNIAAEYKLKSSLARVGLDHLNAGWCDPGWNGSALTLELRNLTTYHFLKLEYGIKIGQMVFFRCDPVPQEASYATRGSYNNNTSVQGALPEEGVNVTEPKGAARALSSPTVVGKALDILFQNSTKEDLFKSVMTKKSEGDTDEHY